MITKTINSATGKESKDTAFNEPNWGKLTRDYLKSVGNLLEGSFLSIVENAQEFAKLSRHDTNSSLTGETDECDRGALVDVRPAGGKSAMLIWCVAIDIFDSMMIPLM